MKLSWLEKIAILLVFLIPIRYEIIHNPIRFHQTVKADGLSMQVPVFWTPVKRFDQGLDKGMLIALRREWARSGTVNVVDRAAVNPTGGPWTPETAQRQRAFITAVQEKDSSFSEPRFLDLPAGRFHAVCTEASIGGEEALTCYIVGTRLQFSYLGSSSYEPGARKMLASLN